MSEHHLKCEELADKSKPTCLESNACEQVLEAVGGEHYNKVGVVVKVEQGGEVQMARYCQQTTMSWTKS